MELHESSECEINQFRPNVNPTMLQQHRKLPAMIAHPRGICDIRWVDVLTGLLVVSSSLRIVICSHSMKYSAPLSFSQSENGFKPIIPPDLDPEYISRNMFTKNGHYRIFSPDESDLRRVRIVDQLQNHENIIQKTVVPEEQLPKIQVPHEPTRKQNAPNGPARSEGLNSSNTQHTRRNEKGNEVDPNRVNPARHTGWKVVNTHSSTEGRYYPNLINSLENAKKKNATVDEPRTEISPKTEGNYLRENQDSHDVLKADTNLSTSGNLPSNRKKINSLNLTTSEVIPSFQYLPFASKPDLYQKKKSTLDNKIKNVPLADLYDQIFSNPMQTKDWKSIPNVSSTDLYPPITSSPVRSQTINNTSVKEGTKDKISGNQFRYQNLTKTMTEILTIAGLLDINDKEPLRLEVRKQDNNATKIDSHHQVLTDNSPQVIQKTITTKRVVKNESVDLHQSSMENSLENNDLMESIENDDTNDQPNVENMPQNASMFLNATHENSPVDGLNKVHDIESQTMIIDQKVEVETELPPTTEISNLEESSGNSIKLADGTGDDDYDEYSIVPVTIGEAEIKEVIVKDDEETHTTVIPNISETSTMRIQSKEGSMEIPFEDTYTEVRPHNETIEFKEGNSPKIDPLETILRGELERLENLLIGYLDELFARKKVRKLGVDMTINENKGAEEQFKEDQHSPIDEKLHNRLRRFTRSAVLNVGLPKLAETGRLLFFSGLKKILWPLFLGIQVIKSIMFAAIFLPSLFGSIAKITSQGSASLAGFNRPSETVSDLNFRDTFDDDSQFMPLNGGYVYNEADTTHNQFGTQQFDSAAINRNALSRFGVTDQKDNQVNVEKYDTFKKPNSKIDPTFAESYQAFKRVPSSSLVLSNYDPFYSPLLSRLDSVFKQLGLETIDENCREKLVCLMYADPTKYAPYSNLVSAQLSRELSELRKPTTENPEILRFFKYMKAAKDGQDGEQCEEIYSTCTEFKDFEDPAMINTYHDINKLVEARKLGATTKVHTG